MRASARLRVELARRPWIYWVLVAATAAVVATGVLEISGRADAERARWGTTVEVLVAVTPIDVGASLAGSVARTGMPAAMLPDDALVELPPDATARQAVSRGAILTGVDVVAASGLTALARPGDLVVTVVEPVDTGAAPGDVVMVTSDGVVLTPAALVVQRRQSTVWLSVERAAAPMVAAASGGAGLSLLLVP